MLRYRSGIGIGLFVAWCCGVGAMPVAAAVGASTGGELSWYFVVWMLLVVGVGVFSMSLEVSLTDTGELVFGGCIALGAGTSPNLLISMFPVGTRRTDAACP